MLNPVIIANIRAFMERVQLVGKEVPAYNQAMIALAVEENAARAPAVVQDVPVALAASPPVAKQEDSKVPEAT